MRLRTLVICLSVALVSALAVAMSAFADGGGRPLTTTLLGANEVPGPGDPDGSGTASLRLNPGTGEICYEISVSNIGDVIAAHIHVGDATVAGPVVVGLTPPTSGTSSGCASADRQLILAILRNSENYYVNVHTAQFPAGAVRGQLGS